MLLVPKAELDDVLGKFNETSIFSLFVKEVKTLDKQGGLFSRSGSSKGKKKEKERLIILAKDRLIFIRIKNDKSIIHAKDEVYDVMLHDITSFHFTKSNLEIKYSKASLSEQGTISLATPVPGGCGWLLSKIMAQVAEIGRPPVPTSGDPWVSESKPLDMRTKGIVLPVVYPGSDQPKSPKSTSDLQFQLFNPFVSMGSRMVPNEQNYYDGAVEN